MLISVLPYWSNPYSKNLLIQCCVYIVPQLFPDQSIKLSDQPMSEQEEKIGLDFLPARKEQGKGEKKEEEEEEEGEEGKEEDEERVRKRKQETPSENTWSRECQINTKMQGPWGFCLEGSQLENFRGLKQSNTVTCCTFKAC